MQNGEVIEGKWDNGFIRVSVGSGEWNFEVK
jgi:hypothetical protein